jgi:hypothetical protein
MKIRPIIYRLAAPLAAFVFFLSLSWLCGWGNPALYEDILRWYGVVPFRFPFVDISGSLAAWECARQGVDVILSDPCDVLHRPYDYSPLWMAASPIPLGDGNTMIVGWCVDLLFIGSLGLLPPPRRPLELMLVLAATLSTMVVFALERANPDILIFILALTAGLLAECGFPLRLFGYCLALAAALLKYYPIMALITVFRERIPVFVAVNLCVAAALALFWAEYDAEIARGLQTIPGGPYNTDLFAAKNLPSLLGEAVRDAAGFSGRASLIPFAGAVYVTLVSFCLVICRRLLGSTEFSDALASLDDFERASLVIGCALIVGCFFAGSSVGYRGVFLLMVIPGLLAITRRPASHDLRILGLGTSVVIVLLMWGECFRLMLYDLLERINASLSVTGQLGFFFWLLRELGWWWAVSVMLAILCSFLWQAPVMQETASYLRRWVAKRTPFLAAARGSPNAERR